MHDSSCPLCASAATTSFTRAAQRYVRCSSCGGISRVLTRGEYDALSPSYDSGPLLEGASESSARQYLGVADKKRFLRRHTRVGPGQRFLDIGCGSGGYLMAATELGMQAVGVEPSGAQVDVARRFGFEVHHGYFAPDTFPQASFDVVLLSHVIEHIFEPASFLRSAADLLRPGGTLLVVTPNADSFVARIAGRHWPMLKPPDHVRMMTRRSFEQLGVRQLGRVTYEDSEYAWEPAATLLSAAREALAGRADAPSTAPHEGAAGGRVGWSAKWAVLRPAFMGLSMPLHLAGRLTGRRACLVMSVQRPA